MKVWGESEHYLDLENEDKKQYKGTSTFSNGELMPDPNVSAFNLLLTWFRNLYLFVDTNTTPFDSLLIIKRKSQKVADTSQNNAASKNW